MSVDDYEWVDGAVPGGREVAQVMVETIHEKGWSTAWGDCQGMRICPRVRVWLDGYVDYDYHQAFLLRVWTTSEPDTDGHTVEVTDHLAVYQRHGLNPQTLEANLDVEWRQDPRLFFDSTHEWRFKGLRWWVDWVEGIQMADWDDAVARRPARPKTPGPAERDRETAKRLGMAAALPYLRDLPQKE